jgi:hypothetical protein
MRVHDFQAKWRQSNLKEKSAAQEHFIDLCRLLDQPTPSEADPVGTSYTFERTVSKLDGSTGFADVWYRGHFAWEYKGKGADLVAAYRQLSEYRDALENPPLLVVSDLDRIHIHTSFTNRPSVRYAFTLDELAQPANLRVLRLMFEDPAALEPGVTSEDVTQAAAERFGELALRLHARGVEPHTAAHFLVQLLFCLFAEDVRLLPSGIFARLLEAGARDPGAFTHLARQLLTAMRDGGYFGAERIAQFNGGLFAELVDVALTKEEITSLATAARLNWASVEPAIFGTLFERSLDPDKRAQLGAHYTGRHDIERVVEPVLMAPLRRHWLAVRAEVEPLVEQWKRERAEASKYYSFNRQRSARHQRNATRLEQRISARLHAFRAELAAVRVLDPACGSGNFLYVALAALLDLEHAVSAYAASIGLSGMFSQVHPRQFSGLEINDYAAELAQVVVWIGYLQWLADHGQLGQRSGSVLESLGTIRLQDALLDRSDAAHPKEAHWPAADVIIGNPPFLGGKRLRAELGDAYVGDLFAVYYSRVPREADLVCYFFEKARTYIEADSVQRAGLLATNSIRGGANRRILERIKETGDIFAAWDDEPWILDGAAVRISIVGFDDGSELTRSLDGSSVVSINADLIGRYHGC